MSQAERRYDRLSVRLSLIISRLLAGETLNMRKLAAEFGVSERTLHRDLSRPRISGWLLPSADRRPSGDSGGGRNAVCPSVRHWRVVS